MHLLSSEALREYLTLKDHLCSKSSFVRTQVSWRR
jgi:hypothetical protein